MSRIGEGWRESKGAWMGQEQSVGSLSLSNKLIFTVPVKEDSGILAEC